MGCWTGWAIQHPFRLVKGSVSGSAKRQRLVPFLSGGSTFEGCQADMTRKTGTSWFEFWDLGCWGITGRLSWAATMAWSCQLLNRYCARSKMILGEISDTPKRSSDLQSARTKAHIRRLFAQHNYTAALGVDWHSTCAAHLKTLQRKSAFRKQRFGLWLCPDCEEKV